ATAERTVEVPPGDGAWLSNDGKFLLVRAQEDTRPARLVAFDLAAGKAGHRPAWEVAQPKDERYWPVSCFSPDGRRVVLLSLGERVERVELWDGPRGKRVWALPGVQKNSGQGSAGWPGLDLTPDRGTRASGSRLAVIHRLAT